LISEKKIVLNGTVSRIKQEYRYLQISDGQANGLATLPLILSRPVAFTNIYTVAELRNCTNRSNVYIPKIHTSATKDAYSLSMKQWR
jgi:hypothetical protein